MSKFTSREWKYLQWPLIGLGGDEQWYLIGSPERAIGFIRYEEDAKLIAAAPELYRMLREELIPTSDYGDLLSFSREAKVRELLDRVDGTETSND